MTARRGVRRYVVDASVAVKWLFDDEDHVPQARALRHAPVLFVYEVANAIRSAAWRLRLPADVAEEALATLLEAPIELHAPDPLTALGTGIRMTISAYDASYVALADELGVECWSGDERLVRASERSAPFVRSISEYER